jgi:hypothetical protein
MPQSLRAPANTDIHVYRSDTRNCAKYFGRRQFQLWRDTFSIRCAQTSRGGSERALVPLDSLEQIPESATAPASVRRTDVCGRCDAAVTGRAAVSRAPARIARKKRISSLWGSSCFTVLRAFHFSLCFACSHGATQLVDMWRFDRVCDPVSSPIRFASVA